MVKFLELKISLSNYSYAPLNVIQSSLKFTFNGMLEYVLICLLETESNSLSSLFRAIYNDNFGQQYSSVLGGETYSLVPINCKQLLPCFELIYVDECSLENVSSFVYKQINIHETISIMQNPIFRFNIFSLLFLKNLVCFYT